MFVISIESHVVPNRFSNIGYSEKKVLEKIITILFGTATTDCKNLKKITILYRKLYNTYSKFRIYF